MIQPFVEIEDSLPCSQEPATGPYHEPHEFNPHLQIILQSTLAPLVVCLQVMD